MTLTVRYDAQIFQAQRRGGISRSFVELMSEFEPRHADDLGVRVSTPFDGVRNEHLLERFPDRFHLRQPPGRLRRRFGRGTPTELPPADVVHFTFYDTEYLAAAVGLPTVSTVHDMIPELLPELFPDGNPHRAKRVFVESSTAVVCVSEATKRDLLATYDGLAADITVIPHGVSELFFRIDGPRVAVPDSYVLFVGQRGAYKDFGVLLAAVGTDPSRHALHLVLVGGGPLTDEERATIAMVGMTDQVHQLDVSDEELPGVYARAECLVYPSRYEGFGMPILEGFAAGCPVVVADTDVFREVAGEAAAFFTPGDSASLAEELGVVLDDRLERRRLVAAGASRVKDFTWRRAAERYADVYRAAADSGR